MLHSLRYRTPFASFCVLAFQIISSAAFSWVLTAPPQQCSNLSIAITGSDGVPPYRIIVVPTGSTPLPNNIEVRHILDQSFDGSSLSFAINYPANSEFVAVVSDSRGFGTGGTSAATTVLTGSGDTSCFNLVTYSPPFVYQVGDSQNNQLAQCQATRIWWDATTVQGTPSFLGIIPGGQSFALQESAITHSSTEGTGFSWTPPIRGGTSLIIVASDGRGTGTGGSAPFTVQLQNDTSCLNSQSPSSTPGVPAGAYPTSTYVSAVSSASAVSSSSAMSSSSAVSSSSVASNGNGGIKKATFIASVAGGAGGGFVLLSVLVLLCYCCWRRRQKLTTQPMTAALEVEPSITTGLIGQTSLNNNRDSILSQYNPEPFAVGPSGRNTETGSAISRPSGLTNASSMSSARQYLMPREPGNQSLSVASSMYFPDQGRGIEFIQHQDAGPFLLPPDDRQTIELPPQYSDNMRPGSRSS